MQNTADEDFATLLVYLRAENGVCRLVEDKCILVMYIDFILDEKGIFTTIDKSSYRLSGCWQDRVEELGVRGTRWAPPSDQCHW